MEGKVIMAGNTTPFFVVGAQRSGTTMFRLMLNQHSRLCVPFESAFIPDFYRRLHEFGDLSRKDNMAALLAEIRRHPFVEKGRLVPDADAVMARNPFDYAGLVDAIFAVNTLRRGKRRWGDKTPGHVLDMDVLWHLFPGCRFVHLVRDGRDVAGSLRTLSWGSRDLVKSARDWSWKVTLGRKMGEMIPGHYLEVRYEALVCEPVRTLARVCDFLGESFESAMLDYHESAENEMPASSVRWHRTSTRAPDRAKVQSWRGSMGLSDQIVFDQVAGNALELFGYERTPKRPTIRSRIRFARYAILGHA